MAVTETPLTSGSSTTDASSYLTASVSPTANRLVLVSICHNTDGGSFSVSGVSGAGLTFTKISEVSLGSFTYLSTWRALNASPSSGQLTIDFGANTAWNIAWSVKEFGGIDTSGTNGSGAIVQSASNTAASTDTISATLAAFGSADNATYGAFGTKTGTTSTAITSTPGTGFSEIHDQWIADIDFDFVNSVHTEWRADNDTTVDATFSRTAGFLGALAIEIKAAASGYSLTVGAGSSALSGQTVSTKYGRSLSAAAGAHTYTGAAVALARGLKAVIAAGAHVLSGQATSLLRGYQATVGTGSYAHTGAAVALLRGALAAVSAAAYSVAGQAVTLTKSAAAGAYSMIAGAGSYLLTGRGIDLIWQSYIAPVTTPVRSGMPLSRAGRSKYQDWLNHRGYRR